jgi:F-type H+-transporting ATPase subunit b
MDSLISIFHLDLGLFIAQLVNFAIVFSVLYFFAFKPLVKIMAERSAKIDKSLKDADETSRRLAAVAQEREEIVKEAKAQANLIGAARRGARSC